MDGVLQNPILGQADALETTVGPQWGTGASDSAQETKQSEKAPPILDTGPAHKHWNATNHAKSNDKEKHIKWESCNRPCAISAARVYRRHGWIKSPALFVHHCSISFSDVHTIGEHDVLVNSENGSVQLYWHLMMVPVKMSFFIQATHEEKSLGAEVDVGKMTGITDPFLKVVICVDVGEVCVGICFSC